MKNLIIFAFIISLIYIAMGIILPNYWVDSYSSYSLITRTENDLPHLSSAYKKDTAYFIENGIQFESWSLKTGEAPNAPFHYQKDFYYSKSFWLWNNSYLGEVNHYQIDLSNDKQMELTSSFWADEDSITYHKSTYYTKQGKERKRIRDSLAFLYAEQNNLYLCGTALIDTELDFTDINKIAFDSIISWHSTTPIGRFINILGSNYRYNPWWKVHPLKQTSYAHHDQLAFFLKQENIKQPTSIKLYYYAYENESDLKNALVNWFNCFGKNCLKIEENKSLNSINENPTIVLIYDTFIVQAEYTYQEEKSNAAFVEKNLIQGFGSNYTSRFTINRYGELHWGE